MMMGRWMCAAQALLSLTALVARAADVPVPGPAAQPSTGAALIEPSQPEAGSPDTAPLANPDDPWEGMNRKVFWFNDQVDVYALEPTAKAWDWVMPQPVQHGIANFFGNLRFPIIFVNDAFQAKPLEAVKELGRFAVNTTIGAVGLLDPASEIGLGEQDEDFGQTLGVWGVPSGPYLVMPLLGASNCRDAGALAVDSITAITPWYLDWWITGAMRIVDVINTRSRFLKEVAEAKAASLDYYTFVRNAYEQRRSALIEDRATHDGTTPYGAQTDEHLYDVPQ
jgi:phospholipid-binding lipoprotein MlaA